MAHVKNNSGVEEWYTPVCYIESARKVMGSIDFDPASCEVANSIVKASTYLTKEQDAIVTDWPTGVNIWCNPPYSRGVIDKFVTKFIYMFNEPINSQAVFLTNNATETRWGNQLLSHCSAVCFPKGRIKFLNESLEEAGKPLQAQMITYFGNHPEVFTSEFDQYGITFIK